MSKCKKALHKLEGEVSRAIEILDRNPNMATIKARDILLDALNAIDGSQDVIENELGNCGYKIIKIDFSTAKGHEHE